MQSEVPTGSTGGATIPGNKLFSYLTLVSGAHNFFSRASFSELFAEHLVGEHAFESSVLTAAAPLAAWPD